MRTNLLAILTLPYIAVAQSIADERRFAATDLLSQSNTSNVRLHADGTAIELDNGVLIEDDGPAAGYSYLPNEERLSDKIWIKKELIIPRSGARKVTLLVGPGGALKAIINGKPIELKDAVKIGGHWQAYSISPDCLRVGKNEIVLYGTGRVWIARAEDFASGSTERVKHPKRSARSTDAGTSWQTDRLGIKGDIAGEYCVRLFLEQRRPTGSLVLPVLDAGNLAKKPIAPFVKDSVPLKVHLDGETGNMGKLTLRIRTGNTIVPDAMNWTGWSELKSGAEIRDAKGRFFQIGVDIATSDPFMTPMLRGIRVEANPPKAEDWSAKSRVTEENNPEMVRSAIPFAYEPFDHPRLKELRAKFKLDDVVKDAKSEIELIERLAKWASQCWDKGHLKDIYPGWDALEILKPYTDGKPIGGFCQHYNMVFLQACESFGIPGRAVSISVGDHGAVIKGSGHEVVELWSNQFKKWIYVDGNMAWYAVDAKTRAPLSLLELRERQYATINDQTVPPTEMVHLREDGKRWTSLTEWPAFLELRMIPRSNFLEQKAPLPLNQGMRGWFWTGHQVWNDAKYPASMLYGQRIADRRNWEWTLNQTRITLEATATPGEVRAHLDTETPGFQTFLANIDGGEKKPVASGFIWKLHAGKNRLEVRSRNSGERDGIPSEMVIEQ